MRSREEMRIDKFFYRANAIMAVLLLAVLNAYGLNDKPAGKFTLTTKSKEAREQVAKAILAIESFQVGQQIQPLAKKAVELDPDFAFAHYLVGATTPPPEAQPYIDKAVAL